MLPEIVAYFTYHVVTPSWVNAILVHTNHQRVPAAIHDTARARGTLTPNHHNAVHPRTRVSFATQ